MLRKANIRAAIQTHAAREEHAAIATAQERDEALTDILRGTMTATSERIAAIRELNKCTGRHSMKHVLEGRLTLEDALEASRR